jgi:hypothetical protein
MQELHQLLSDTSVGLRGEGSQGVAVWLHSCMCGLLLVVHLDRSCSCQYSGCREGVAGEGVDDGHIGDGDALGHGQEDVHSSTLAGALKGLKSDKLDNCDPKVKLGW